MFKAGLLAALFLVSGMNFAEAKKHNHNRVPQTQYGQGDDSQLVDACNARRRTNFVEGSGMEVVQVLPDDTRGSQHQKWVVRLSSGKQVVSVYNLDITERVPLKVGDLVDMGGEFLWTNEGCMIHWLHADPKKRRPDGYVRVNGESYGEVTH
jgi:hypothetical protein